MAISLLLALGIGICAGLDDYDLTPLDGFEGQTPWAKGDPNTDLQQRDSAVATSTEMVKEGEQSLAFIIHVNWTPREGEQYPKGWPMARRVYDAPQDWSRHDRVLFWLYTQTDDPLPGDRVLRCGPSVEGGGEIDWYTLLGIEPNTWQLMSVPLDADKDFTHVTGFSFYVAEAWYADGDKVTFYIDDMQLATRKWPAIADWTVSSRVYPRGDRVAASVSLEGHPADAELRLRINDLAGAEELTHSAKVTERRTSIDLPARALPPGSHMATIELADREGTVRETQSHYFRTMQPGRRTYLSLITFYTPQLMDATAEQLAVLNDSAYAGVAIGFGSGYDTDPPPDFGDMQAQMKLVRDTLTIDPWPWVFINRIIGAPADGTSHASSHAKDLEYFARIPIMDLDNETGAKADMLKLWRNAVRAAEQWGSPGIVLDKEAYNNYKSYDVGYVARERGESLGETISKCEALGAELAGIVEQEYPECIVWTLFSRLDRPVTVAGYPDPVHPVPGHVSLGFLKYAKEHNLPCKYLCGGEVDVGYYNPNVAALKQKIAARDANLAWALQQFPDHFFLAGTISPYHDHAILTSWIQKNAGGNPELKTIADFQPMFRTLFDAYDWVWIYAASAAKTLPYSPENSALYSDVLSAALDEAEGEK